MTVIVLVAAPPGLRGHLTRWMVQAGVFVGNPGRRIRDRLWTVLAERIGDGQAVMVEPANNEQGWTMRTAGTRRWYPVDFDGLTLICPTAEAKGLISKCRPRARGVIPVHS